jgi:hypothetical protein
MEPPAPQGLTNAAPAQTEPPMLAAALAMPEHEGRASSQTIDDGLPSAPSAMAPAEQAEPPMMEPEPPARARAQRQAELTPELRQSNRDRADARVAEIDQQLTPNNITKAATEMAAKANVDDVRADPTKNAMLRAQLVQEYSPENLDFLDVTDRNPRSKREAKAIYEKFIKEGAPQQVNIGGTKRFAVEARIKKFGLFFNANRDGNMFAESRQEIKNVVSRDTLFRAYRVVTHTHYL